MCGYIIEQFIILERTNYDGLDERSVRKASERLTSLEEFARAFGELVKCPLSTILRWAMGA